MRIKYCSAPCGSGKTRQVVQRACEFVAQDRKVLILQPTVELIEKTIQEELITRPNPPLHKVFYKRKVGDGSVSRAIADELQGPNDVPRIIFAPHQAFPHIKHFGDKSEWHVLVDEELQVVRYKQHRIRQTHSLLTDHLDVTPVDTTYGLASPKDSHLQEIAKNADEDELLETLAGTALVIVNPNWRTFVNIQQFDRMKRGEGQILGFHSTLNTKIIDGFAGVLAVAANFEDTLMFRLWSRQGVEFEADTQFAKGLRYVQHPNGNLVTIRYASEQQWSRRRRNTAFGEGGITGEGLIIRAAKDRFGSNPFVWHGNTSITGNPFGRDAERLPNKPHGLNTFAGIDNAVFLSSLNPPTDHFHFLHTQGLDGDVVKRAIYCSTGYQSIMRISTRDLNNEQPKLVLVPDRALADYLHHQFSDSKLEKMEIGITDEPKPTGRPRKHNSDREKAAIQRQKAKERRIQILKEHLRLNSQDMERSGCGDHKERGESRHETPIRLYSTFDTQLPPDRLTCSFFESINSPTPLVLASCETDDDLVEMLRDVHDNCNPSKESNCLFSPAIFDPNLAKETKRGRANIVHLAFVALDFENGELRPEELAEILSDIRVIATNTFRHTPDRPRYRAIIPSSERMTADVYGLVCEAIANRLEDAGCSVRKRVRQRVRSNMRPSGLDWSKTQPHSLFYLPCQAQNPADSFFMDFSGPTRSPITPSAWVENVSIPLQPELEMVPEFENRQSQINGAMVGEAVGTWRISVGHPGRGDQMFFHLALGLRRAGMSHQQIEATLGSEAQYGRSPSERLAQIPSIMASLRKSFARAS